MILHLRARRVPVALAAAVGTTALIWALWLIFSDGRDVADLVVVLTVALMVSALSTTLAGPDEDLERTAALRWPRWRAVHLLAAVGVVLVGRVPAARRRRAGGADRALRDGRRSCPLLVPAAGLDGRRRPLPPVHAGLGRPRHLAEPAPHQPARGGGRGRPGRHRPADVRPFRPGPQRTGGPLTLIATDSLPPPAQTQTPAVEGWQVAVRSGGHSSRSAAKRSAIAAGSATAT